MNNPLLTEIFHGYYKAWDIPQREKEGGGDQAFHIVRNFIHLLVIGGRLQDQFKTTFERISENGPLFSSLSQVLTFLQHLSKYLGPCHVMGGGGECWAL